MVFVQPAFGIASQHQVVALGEALSASAVAAALSGLLPDLAKDTSRVGRSSARYSFGLETMSVVATASKRRPSRRDSAEPGSPHKSRRARAGEERPAGPAPRGVARKRAMSSRRERKISPVSLQTAVAGRSHAPLSGALPSSSSVETRRPYS